MFLNTCYWNHILLVDIYSQAHDNYWYNSNNDYPDCLSCQQIQARSQKIASMGREAYSYLFLGGGYSIFVLPLKNETKISA